MRAIEHTNMHPAAGQNPGSTNWGHSAACAGKCRQRLSHQRKTMLADIGLTVARQIPIETIGGLVSGAYSLHGGVVRDAGGRIVSHLVSSGAQGALSSLVPGTNLLTGMLQNVQLWQLGKDVAQLQSSLQTVLNVSMAGATLSGLGLVTSITGFALLNHRMKAVDAKLAVLEQEVKGIKDLLVGLQRSKLQFAIDNVRHAESATNSALSRDLLLQSKREFGTLSHHYKDQWARSRTVREIDTLNELYTLAVLGHATVCSNLGLGRDAAHDLRLHSGDWTRLARHHAKTLLFTDRPDRLLSGEYVEVLPAKSLVGLLDFAHDARRGIDWLDDLRTGQSRNGSVFDNLTASAPVGLQRMLGKSDVAEFVSAAQSLRARAEVMDAHVEHFEFLEAKRLTSSGFQHMLNQELQMLGAEAICVSAVAKD